MALELIKNITKNGLPAYADASKDDHDIAGSGVFSKDTNNNSKNKLGNAYSCSVFPPEHLAVDIGLKAIEDY